MSFPLSGTAPKFVYLLLDYVRYGIRFTKMPHKTMQQNGETMQRTDVAALISFNIHISPRTNAVHSLQAQPSEIAAERQAK